MQEATRGLESKPEIKELLHARNQARTAQSTEAIVRDLRHVAASAMEARHGTMATALLSAACDLVPSRVEKSDPELDAATLMAQQQLQAQLKVKKATFRLRICKLQFF